MLGEPCFAVRRVPTRCSPRPSNCSTNCGPKALCVIAWARNWTNCASERIKKRKRRPVDVVRGVHDSRGKSRRCSGSFRSFPNV